MLQRGVLLFFDYGFPHREYYHPQRASGTLMCHYRQHAHDDPLLQPGLQDITAHVDFTAVAEAGETHGLKLIGYTTQAQFLINCGITELLSAVSPADMAAYLPLASQAQKLLSPSEMGEIFKVITFCKNLEIAPLGFMLGDKRHVL
jgi:SAM-dependent MidA family methyltransferase